MRSRNVRKHSKAGPDISGVPLERTALDQLFSVTYEELRRLAATVRRNEPTTTLSPTALVNEAWLKLVRSPEFATTSHLHFKRIAARAMRQVLVEAARRRLSSKRGGDGGLTIALVGDPAIEAPLCREDLLALESALQELERLDPRQALLVESRFYGGLNVAETASLLDISEATVHREWKAARAWLKLRLREVE
ncbi:MAG TPA: ECF-type sigma factor [Bryobacteraceae bacterium]|nr:ECF-type sigma factor [Bryobacteraceae bacterium]